MTLYDNENTRLSMFAFRSIMHVGWEKPNILTKCKQVLSHELTSFVFILIGLNCLNFIHNKKTLKKSN